MRHVIRMRLVTAAAVGILCGGHEALGSTPTDKCQAGKNRVVGKYDACRHHAEAKRAATGDPTLYMQALEKCAAKFGLAWQKLEANAAGACPSNGDEIGISNVVTGCTLNIATALGGGPLVDCPTDLGQCGADLATCQAGLAGPDGQRLRTGQTSCYDGVGTVIPCAGTGQDGELQKGLARSYTDNGDGTVTDHRTGLVWEKLSADGTVHDKDATFTLPEAFTMKIAQLNAIAFGGSSDWRLPNRAELESLVDLGRFSPAVDPIFNTACASGCTVMTCSCTHADIYWTATTFPGGAYLMHFDDGIGNAGGTTGNARVRGVRGG